MWKRSVGSKIEDSMLYQSLLILPKSDRPKLFLVAVLQVVLNLLDLLGVGLIGLIGALSVQGVQSLSPSGRVEGILRLLKIDELSFQSQASILGIAAVAILVSKTIFSILISRKILYFLSRRGAIVSSELMSKVMSQSLLDIQRNTMQQNLYAITSGVSSITLGVLGILILLISDLSLVIIIGVGLLIINPTIAILTSLIFALVGYLLYKLMHERAVTLGTKEAQLNILSNEKIVEVLSSYRESVVRNRRSFYALEVKKMRLELADTLAELALMPNISKYIVETTLVVSALLVSAVQFMLLDAKHAVATLAIFIAAGSRLAPAALRIQQSSIQIKRNLGAARPTLMIVEQLKDTDLISLSVDALDLEHQGFVPDVEFSEVSFQYPGSNNFALQNLNFKIKVGEMIAFVGSSGAGKTTLVDLLLGILRPEKGLIRISGVSTEDAVKIWPGAIAYVPQDVVVVNGTLKENICLGYPADSASDDWYWRILEAVGLDSYFSHSENGLDSQLGERGSLLSGGQRQRIGIARALFTNPKLLILDEATSALDGETEAKIIETLDRLGAEVTVCIIAHRLSSIRSADKIAYMKDGNIIQTGKFEELRLSIDEFDNQAKLMGL
jgi:ABC-type multidrug transport system fused ATPase/permease subunit